VTYLLSCNLSEVLVVGAAVLVGLPFPLMPLQILFLNLVTDVFPVFALGVGEGSNNILDRPPPARPLQTHRDPAHLDRNRLAQPGHFRGNARRIHPCAELSGFDLARGRDGISTK